MRVYNSVYIGVYVEVPHVKSTRDVEYYANPETGKKVKNKFDAQSGVENELKTRVETYYSEPQVYEIEGLHEDEFFSPAYAGPDKTTTFFSEDYGRTLDSDELRNVDLADIDMVGNIQEFKDKFLSKLVEANKEFDINIRFGVVYYAH